MFSIFLAASAFIKYLRFKPPIYVSLVISVVKVMVKSLPRKWRNNIPLTYSEQVMNASLIYVYYQIDLGSYRAMSTRIMSSVFKSNPFFSA